MKGTGGRWKVRGGIIATSGLLAVFLAHPSVAAAAGDSGSDVQGGVGHDRRHVGQ